MDYRRPGRRHVGRRSLYRRGNRRGERVPVSRCGARPARRARPERPARRHRFARPRRGDRGVRVANRDPGWKRRPTSVRGLRADQIHGRRGRRVRGHRDGDGAASSDTLYVDVEAGDEAPAGGGPPTAAPAPAENPVGVDPPMWNAPASDCAGDCAEDVQPWIEIDGPSTVGTDREVTFEVRHGGFSSEPRIGWSISGHGERATEIWYSPGDQTIYAT